MRKFGIRDGKGKTGIGNVTREFIIDFFVLMQPDVEWYKIRIKEEGR